MEANHLTFQVLRVFKGLFETQPVSPFSHKIQNVNVALDELLTPTAFAIKTLLMLRCMRSLMRAIFIISLLLSGYCGLCMCWMK